MLEQTHFTPELFTLLRQLKRHNNREWFQANKKRYETNVRDALLRFIEDFRPRLHRISPHFIADPRRTGGSLLRIHRDLRFRPDADPYQTMAAARFPHVAWKQTHSPGLYLHLEPEQSFLGIGLWHPDPDSRARVRNAIIADPTLWKKVTRSKRFSSMCELGGDFLKRMPPGYPPDHPLADDLKRKDFICATRFSQEEVCARGFLDRATYACLTAAPFLEFLTRSLGLPWSAEEQYVVREVASVETMNL